MAQLEKELEANIENILFDSMQIKDLQPLFFPLLVQVHGAFVLCFFQGKKG